jgi:DNA gyrase subunit B
LKGKILNVEKARPEKMLANKEIITLVTALGAGIHDEFDVEKIRYHNIIIMTDADVDGSHIRTLILTFFYRMMVEIIENGYLYLAQPPLYRVAKGKNERYLQNDEELNQFLVEQSVSEYSVRVERTGRIYSGLQLRDLMNLIFEYNFYMDRLERRGYDCGVLRILLKTELKDARDLQSAEQFELLRERLEAGGYAVDYRGMDEEHSLQRYQASKMIEGRYLSSLISYELLDSADYRSLCRVNQELDELREPPFIVVKNNAEAEIEHSATSKEELLQTLLDRGRRSLTLQRYKGLGEMNPQQLWETTMDPDKRVLLQVKLEDAVAAEDTFSILMGENVEARKDFIWTHALEVSNLDV